MRVACCIPTYSRWHLLSSDVHALHALSQHPLIDRVFILNQNRSPNVPDSFLETALRSRSLRKLRILHTPRNKIDTRISFMQSCASDYDYVLSLDDDYNVSYESFDLATKVLSLLGERCYIGFVPRFVDITSQPDHPIYHGNAANPLHSDPPKSLVIPESEQSTYQSMLHVGSSSYNLLLTGASIVAPRLLLDDESISIRHRVTDFANGEDIYMNYVIACNQLRAFGRANFCYVHSPENRTMTQPINYHSQSLSAKPDHLTKRFLIYRDCLKHFNNILPVSNEYVRA